jgi:hypothetical protein
MAESLNPYQAPITVLGAAPERQPIHLTATEISRAMTGLRIMFWALLVNVILSWGCAAVAGYFGYMFASGRMPAAQYRAIAKSVSIGVAMVASVRLLIQACGCLYCLPCTREVGKRGIVLASAILLAVAVALIIGLQSGVNFPGAKFSITGIEFIAILMFMVFLAALARYLGADRAARNARATIMICGVGIAAVIAGTIAAAMSNKSLEAQIANRGLNDPLDTVAKITLLVMGLAMVVAMIMYLVVTSQVRSALRRCEPAPVV